MKTLKVLTAVICICAMLFGLSACSKKTPQTVDGFRSTMEEAGFEIIDVTQAADSDNRATAVIVAKSVAYQIDFWEITDEKTAESMFEGFKTTFDNEHPVKTLGLANSSGNYDYYEFMADGTFHMVSRIGNTIIRCEAPDTYKDEVKGYLETLGYRE